MSAVNSYEISQRDIEKTSGDCCSVGDFLVNLPWGSGLLFMSVFNNKISGKEYLFALDQLKQELLNSDIRIEPITYAKLSRRLLTCDLDVARFEVLNAILSYLAGCAKAVEFLMCLIEGEKLIAPIDLDRTRVLEISFCPAPNISRTNAMEAVT